MPDQTSLCTMRDIRGQRCGQPAAVRLLQPSTGTDGVYCDSCAGHVESWMLRNGGPESIRYEPMAGAVRWEQRVQQQGAA